MKRMLMVAVLVFVLVCTFVSAGNTTNLTKINGTWYNVTRFEDTSGLSPDFSNMQIERRITDNYTDGNNVSHISVEEYWVTLERTLPSFENHTTINITLPVVVNDTPVAAVVPIVDAVIQDKKSSSWEVLGLFLLLVLVFAVFFGIKHGLLARNKKVFKQESNEDVALRMLDEGFSEDEVREFYELQQRMVKK